MENWTRCVNGKVIPLTEEEIIEIKNEQALLEPVLALDRVINKRRSEYKSLSDQIDMLIKCLDHLRDSGIDLGPEGDQLVNDALKVKMDNPKPGG